ncbi:MAG TPA: hypothetical protein VFT60_02695 [Bryobacteraceae bacterium]|jgi:hypothetical protein|nr:hypothetical protein [Bryobacteraceae bacterium]
MPRQRNIEEEFHAIAPQSWQGLPAAAPIVVGLSGAESGTSWSQASQEIALLEAQFRQQTAFLQANLQSLTTNSRAGGGSVAEDVASHFGGGFSGLGLLSPVVSGLLSLFGAGGSKNEPDPLPLYTAPPSVQISDTLRETNAPQAANAAPQVTVHVNAMDSQSFMDRSTDIANAVREAMLNLHPINDVVASL